MVGLWGFEVPVKRRCRSLATATAQHQVGLGGSECVLGLFSPVVGRVNLDHGGYQRVGSGSFRVVNESAA